jgi:hypothetical protein
MQTPITEPEDRAISNETTFLMGVFMLVFFGLLLMLAWDLVAGLAR